MACQRFNVKMDKEGAHPSRKVRLRCAPRQEELKLKAKDVVPK